MVDPQQSNDGPLDSGPLDSGPAAGLAAACAASARRAAEAAGRLAVTSGQTRDRWLLASADALRAAAGTLQTANERDLDAAPAFGLTDAQIDRLRLTSERIESIAVSLEEVARLPDPVGQIVSSNVRPNGLEIQKVRVPLGVVFFIYESRPNVTADAAAICVKSGNAVILRGGKEAAHSSRAIVDTLQAVADRCGLPRAALQLVGTTERAAVGHFLQLDQYIDVAIPRGGKGLIQRVVDEARMPVIKHFDGNCHVYVDCDADLVMASRIVINAKCQRMGVCNACESLLVHRQVAEPFLARIAPALAEAGVEVRGDDATCRLVPAARPATAEDFATEYLGPCLSVGLVDSLQSAVEHINRFGSHHTDAIVTSSLPAAREFAARVDSAAVMINASTRFNDGGQFGLGAEIGISTDKLHARGPCGVQELTSYKYVVYGTGQVRG